MDKKISSTPSSTSLPPSDDRNKSNLLFHWIEIARNNETIFYLWVIFIFLTSLVTAFVIPSYITFTKNDFVPIEMFYLAYAIPVIYTLDFIFSLLGAIYLWKNKTLEKKACIKLMIKVFFQAIPMFPYLLIEIFFIQAWGGGNIQIGSLKWFYFLPILHMVKIVGVYHYWIKFEKAFYINPNVARLLNFAIFLALLSHWITCGWVVIRSSSSPLANGSDIRYLDAPLLVRNHANHSRIWRYNS